GAEAISTWWSQDSDGYPKNTFQGDYGNYNQHNKTISGSSTTTKVPALEKWAAMPR
ncbi:hypothetical protein E4U45_005736, partial [Claviceps purpurea]